MAVDGLVFNCVFIEEYHFTSQEDFHSSEEIHSPNCGGVNVCSSRCNVQNKTDARSSQILKVANDAVCQLMITSPFHVHMYTLMC